SLDTRALRALQVRPRGRQRRNRDAVLDAVPVARPVADASGNFPLEVVTRTAVRRVAWLRGWVVGGAVLAVGARVARVDGLDALRERQDDAVRGGERGDRAVVLSAAAVGVRVAPTEAVLCGVALTQLRARHREELVRTRDPLSVGDQGLARDVARGRA